MRKTLLLVLLLAGLHYSYAQESTIKFDHLTVREGLPERVVQFVQQDSQGYIWIGTQNGLLRYDGYKPKVYRFGVDKNALSPSCSVGSMHEDKDKNLWFTTYENGLFRYNRATDSFIQYKYPEVNGKPEFTIQFFPIE